jgi:nucleoside-diphosphate-sugar epimerase
MKTLVIGGSGFIGSKLIEQLLPENDIINIDKNPSKLYPYLTRVADIRDIQALERNISSDVSSVILLAAEHRDDVSPVSLYYDVNVSGTKNVLEVLSKKNINKVVFTSTVAVYGLNKVNPSEDTKVDPFNDYGRSKWQAEQLLLEWQNEKPGERTAVILRPTVVFGPDNRGNVYNLLNQMIAGKFMMIGTGNNKKSMSYVDNICGFINYCLTNNFTGYHLYNYVDKADLTMNELISLAEMSLSRNLIPLRIPYAFGYAAGACFDLCSRITGKKFSISSIRVKKFCATTQFSSDKMLATGYVPETTLQQGLLTTMEAIKMNNKAVAKMTKRVARVKTSPAPFIKMKEAV